jgi:hypothetical protein
MMKEFHFNDCHVCTNPNIIHIECGHWYTADIETAEHNGKWMFGLNVKLPLSYFGYLPSYGGCDKRAFPTEREARITCIRECIKFVQKEIGDYRCHPLTPYGDELAKPSPKVIHKYNELLSMLHDKMNEIRQLSLFDF